MVGDDNENKTAWKSEGTYIKFNQTEFFGEDASDGYVFIPNNCRGDGANCKVHFAFHDCYRKVCSLANNDSYNAIAALNNMIMVYPGSECWGTGENSTELTREKLHIGVKSMIDRVTETFSLNNSTNAEDCNDCIDAGKFTWGNEFYFNSSYY